MMNILWSLAAFIVGIGVLITCRVSAISGLLVAVAWACAAVFRMFRSRALAFEPIRHGTEYVLAIIPPRGLREMLGERLETGTA